jgi:beta-glucosidase
VQLYVRDLIGCVVRPVKELKGFQKVFLKKGESRLVTFNITPDNLKFYNDQIQYINEAGDYEIFIGNSSNANLKGNFKLTL